MPLASAHLRAAGAAPAAGRRSAARPELRAPRSACCAASAAGPASRPRTPPTGPAPARSTASSAAVAGTARARGWQVPSTPAHRWHCMAEIDGHRVGACSAPLAHLQERQRGCGARAGRLVGAAHVLLRRQEGRRQRLLRLVPGVGLLRVLHPGRGRSPLLRWEGCSGAGRTCMAGGWLQGTAADPSVNAAGQRRGHACTGRARLQTRPLPAAAGLHGRPGRTRSASCSASWAK